jgi:hypothetical protein
MAGHVSWFIQQHKFHPYANLSHFNAVMARQLPDARQYEEH